MVAIVCLVLFSAGGQLFSDVRTTALTYGTFGAYIIIPIFLISGFVIGEVTPVLLVGGTMLFSIQAYRNLFQIKPGSLASEVDWIFRRGIILFFAPLPRPKRFWGPTSLLRNWYGGFFPLKLATHCHRETKVI
jgi:hypothetical protein